MLTRPEGISGKIWDILNETAKQQMINTIGDVVQKQAEKVAVQQADIQTIEALISTLNLKTFKVTDGKVTLSSKGNGGKHDYPVDANKKWTHITVEIDGKRTTLKNGKVKDWTVKTYPDTAVQFGVTNPPSAVEILKGIGYAVIGYDLTSEETALTL